MSFKPNMTDYDYSNGRKGTNTLEPTEETGNFTNYLINFVQ